MLHAERYQVPIRVLPSFYQPTCTASIETEPVATENSVRAENTRFTIPREIIVVSTMNSLLVALLALITSIFRTRAALQTEVFALRHQLAVLHANAPRRLRLKRSDRLLWVLLSRFWRDWRRCLQIVQPATVVTWHRRAFAWYWTRKSRRRPGRPDIAAEIRDLIRRMSQANPLWGAPRIHGELLKLGIKMAPSTVAKYLRRPWKPPSQTWRAFLVNHAEQMASIDFFTVPTATFRVLFVFVVLSHARRRVLHFQVTEHPTQEWTMQQIREAFPWEQVPRYLLRDRDAIYGRDFAALTTDMGMEEVVTAPRAPWQNPYVERLVGSIRRECLDHVIVWNQRSLRRILRSYFAYYQHSRTHLALGKDAPDPRTVEPPDQGRVFAIPQVGGLHHRYQRRAA
jgi:putative transposase